MSQDFEKFAKKTFHQHEMEVDTEALWDSVYPEVRKKKKRRYLFWLFLMASLLAFFSLFAIYFHQGKVNNALLSVSEQTFEPNKIFSLATDQNKENNTNLPSKAIDNGSKTTESIKKLAPLSVSTQKERKNNSAPTAKNEIPNFTPSKTTAIPTSPKQISSDSKQQFIDKPTHSSSISPTTTTKNINSFLLSSLSAFPLLPPERAIDSLDFSPVEDWTPFERPKQAKWGIGSYAGIGYAKRTLSNSQQESLIESREAVEKELESLQLGLSVYYHPYQQLYLRSGIEYSRMASRIQIRNVDVSTDTISNGIRTIYVNAITGDTTNNMGPIYNSRTVTNIQTNYNYFHLIDIPLMVGYQFDFRKWSVGLEAGVLFNLLLESRGSLPVESDRYYNISTDRVQWYRNRLGLTPMVNVHLTYHLAPNRQIYLAPYYRFPKVFSTSEHPLKERLSILGLQSGIRFYF